MSNITPHYRSVKELLQSRSFSIDEYQREYKWEKKHVDELLSDLLGKFQNCYRAGDTTAKVTDYEPYFLGSIIVSRRNEKNYLIDGQQRVTSLTLLLICLYRACNEKHTGVVQTIAPLIYSDNFGEPKFNLDIPERLPVIEALFQGVPFNSDGKDESIQTMHARYEDIEQNELIGELGEALPHFAYWLMNKVGLIEISSDSDNYAYAIFETMNDRGKSLSPVDMLKAYLLAPINDQAKLQRANSEWKRQVLDLISYGGVHEPERDANCIKAWLRSQYAETIRDRKAGASDKDWEIIGTVFHRWVRDNRGRLSLGTEQENFAMICERFPFYAKAYRIILDASRTYTKGLEAVYYNAHNDFTWQSTVLLASLDVTDDDDTVRSKSAATAIYLDIWLMRRVVNYIRVGYSSASYAMWLLCREIRRKPLSELVTVLSEKLAADDVTFKGHQAKGRGGVDQLGLNQFSRRYIFHLLARLTAFTEASSGRADIFDQLVDRERKNPFDIEHILPDKFAIHSEEFENAKEFQEWRNHVGSLLLLPADVNRSLQDKPYEEKAPHYAKQNLFAASLDGSVYQHQPQFEAFRQRNSLPFHPLARFGKTEQLERRALVESLVEEVWSAERLKGVLL